MEQTSLNPQTPSAGSSTSASASAVPLFLCVHTRADFVGNNVTRVGNYGVSPIAPPLNHVQDDEGIWNEGEANNASPIPVAPISSALSA